MPSKPTQRTLAHYRKLGYRCDIVERWNPWSRVRQDLLGFIDVMLLGDGETIGVQTTSGSNLSKRVDKILNERREEATAWLRAGNRIFVNGWALRGPRGKRKVWTLKEQELTLRDMNARTRIPDDDNQPPGDPEG